jgi:NlpC/P60 family
LCVAGLLLGGPVVAAPEATPEAQADPVMRLLEERGLLEPGRDAPLIRQVRDTASDLVITAMNFIGVRYRSGGNSADTGFDCSGFTRHIFERSLGLLLPRRADEQAAAPGLLRIDQNDLRPGDLVFFNTLRRTFSHVGIYVGDGKFIHSPRTGSSVRVEDMRMDYWQKRFNGARRVPQVQSQEAARIAP